MDSSKKLIHGLSAFPITPQNAEGVVDQTALRELVDGLIAANVHSIGLLGSTGTYAFLSREQRRVATEIAATAIKQAKDAQEGNVPRLLVGIGHLRTDQACLLAQDAARAGADAGLLSPVSYNPLTDEEVFEHFKTVAAAVPELPLVIYSNTGTTRFTFSDALIARMAAELPTVVGVKRPSAETPEDAKAQFAALAAAVGPRGSVDFTMGYSRDHAAPEGLLAGGEAWFSVLGGLCPASCLAIFEAAKKGDAEGVRSIVKRLAPVLELMKVHGSLRVAYSIVNLLELAGKGVEVVLPRPLLALNDEVQQQVRRALTATGLLPPPQPVEDNTGIDSSTSTSTSTRGGGRKGN